MFREINFKVLENALRIILKVLKLFYKMFEELNIIIDSKYKNNLKVFLNFKNYMN